MGATDDGGTGGRDPGVVACFRLPVCLLTAVALTATAPHALAATTVVGRVAGGTLPPAAKGAAVVHAVSPATTRILAAARVRRNGGYRLAVPAGVVSVLVDVVRVDRPVRSAITPFVRARRGRRTSLRVSLKRRRPVKPKASRSAVRAADGGPPAVAVKWFQGSGPHAVLGRGLADMVMTDLVSRGKERCGLTVVEFNRRDLIQQELDLQGKYPDLFDPSTTVTKRWIEPAVFVVGSVDTTASSASWSLRIVDAKTGAVLGTEDGTAGLDGVFDAESGMADRLLDQLCPRSYEVTLDLATTSTWPAVSSQATLHSVLTATGGSVPGTSTGTATATYEGASYTSHIPVCSYVPEASKPGTWKAVVRRSGEDAIEVTWSVESDISATGFVTCTMDGYTTTAGNQPGPFLVDPAPTTFTLPGEGGTQAIGGGLSAGGGGWAHTGTMTIRPLD